MFSYVLWQSQQLIFIPILIVIVVVVLIVVFVLTGGLQLLRSRMQPRRLSTQTAHKQEDIREQLEVTTQQLVETQGQLEETHRQLVETQEQLMAAQEQLREARESESQGDSLIGDDLLNNKAWIKLTQECVTLFDELDRKSASMDPRRQELASYVCSQLEEILERCGVTIISGDSAFDERRHRPSPAVSRVAAGTAIAETLSPGFVVGPRVLRRARVRLAEETE